ncbi:MAG: hypothetical protein R6U44_12110 [Archaeoglobaceae archaeon]
MQSEEIESIIMEILGKLPRGKHPIAVIPDLFPPLENEIGREKFEAALKSLEDKGKVRTYEKLSKTEISVSLTTIDEITGTDFAYHDSYKEQDLAGVELIEE